MNSTADRTGSRMERKKEETRQKIVNTAIGLFGLHGFNETSMDLIAREADIAKGTLYNYFPVKEAILEEFIERSFKRENAHRINTLNELSGTRVRMKTIFKELIEGIQTQKDLFEKYIVYQMQKMISFQNSEKLRSGLSLLKDEIIRLGQKSGELRCDLPSFVVDDLFMFAFIETVKQYYFAPGSFEFDRIADQSIELFMNGLAP